jgi:serine/threonine-protein kinase HipA
MAISRDGFRASQLQGCVDAAPTYGLTPAGAREIIDRQLDIIHTEWDDAAEVAQLTSGERRRLWERQILNGYATEGY